MYTLGRQFHASTFATLRRLSRPFAVTQLRAVPAIRSSGHSASPSWPTATLAPCRVFASDLPLPPTSPQSNESALAGSRGVPGPLPSASKKPIPVELKEEDLEEQFVRGGGNGGQKVNKTSNCVILTHRPTGLQVRCHDTRSLSDNRRIARKRLKLKLDDHINGPLSKRALKEAEERRKKLNRQKKAKKGPSAAGGKKAISAVGEAAGGSAG